MPNIDTSKEAVAKVLDGVTNGPWPMNTVRTSCGVCHQIGPWPHKWNAGEQMHACIYDDYPSPPEGTDAMLANARFISATRELVPALSRDLEAMRAERDALRARVAELERVMRAQAEAIIDQVRVTRAYAADSDMGASNVRLVEINTSHFLDYANELRAALSREGKE